MIINLHKEAVPKAEVIWRRMRWNHDNEQQVGRDLKRGIYNIRAFVCKDREKQWKSQDRQ